MLEKEGERKDRLTYNEMRLQDPATGQVPAGIRQRELEFAKDLPAKNRGLDKSDDSASDWEIRGPGNIGGRARGLVIDVSDPTFRTLLAGGVSGGMWRSTDDGDTWARVTDPGQLLAISCLVQDTRPGHQNVFYYGTGETEGSSAGLTGDLYRGDGIYKSIDGGLSWQVLPATSTGIPQETDQQFDFVHNLAIDTSEATYDEVYAAAGGLVYRSIDGGDTWDAVLGDSSNPGQFSDVIVSPTGVVYAGISSVDGLDGIFRSTNGVDWTDIDSLNMASYSRLVLALAPSNENILYVTHSEQSYVYGTNDQFAGLGKYTYLSGDGSGSGGAWDDRSQNLIFVAGTAWPYDFYYTQYAYNQCTAVLPNDPDTVILGGVDVWRSSDGFTTKDDIDVVGGLAEKSHHADVHQIIFQPGSNQVAYSASDGGIHKTLDITATKVRWTSLNNGFYTTQFYTVAVDQDRPGDPTIIGGTQDNGTLWAGSDDLDFEWTQPLGGDGAYCAIIDSEASPGEYFFSAYNNYIYHAQIDSKGRTVAKTNVTPKSLENYDFLFINPFIIDPVAEQIMYLATRQGVWRNDNWWEIPMQYEATTDINWVQLTDVPAYEYVSALAVAPTGDRALFYGTALGKIYRVTNAPYAPAGILPTSLNNQATFPEGAYVSGICVHPEDDQKVLLCFGNYMVSNLWYSQDGGLSWVEVEGNLAGDDGPSVRAVKIMPYEGTDHWFIGTSIGVLSTVYSEGEPVVWELEAENLIGNAIVDALAIRPADGLVVAATHGLGIYSMNMQEPGPDKALASSSIITHNAPNPFNPMTTISYTLSRSEQVSLRVFDVAGKLVRVLRSGSVEQAGQHQVVWDGTDGNGRQVPSGVYLYKLVAGANTTTKKMNLLR